MKQSTIYEYLLDEETSSVFDSYKIKLFEVIFLFTKSRYTNLSYELICIVYQLVQLLTFSVNHKVKFNIIKV